MGTDDRRDAERYSPPRPVPATFGGFAVSIVDISLIGCRIEHVDRLPPRARLALRFSWRGSQARIDATITRSELTSLSGKKAAYVSGLQFCDAVDASPPVIRDIVGWLRDAAKKPDDEVELLSAGFLRCTLASGRWTRLYVEDPTQPPDGFTIPAPPNEREADPLCRAWEQADAANRQMMRATFERKTKAT